MCGWTEDFGLKAAELHVRDFANMMDRQHFHVSQTAGTVTSLESQSTLLILV